MDPKERIRELERELALCRKKIRELAGEKSALEQEVELLKREAG